MAAFVLHKKLSDVEIREDAAQVIVDIETFFSDNAKRKTATAKLWYGRTVEVRRGHVAEDVNNAADDAIANGKP